MPRCDAASTERHLLHGSGAIMLHRSCRILLLRQRAAKDGPRAIRGTHGISRTTWPMGYWGEHLMLRASGRRRTTVRGRTAGFSMQRSAEGSGRA